MFSKKKNTRAQPEAAQEHISTPSATVNHDSSSRESEPGAAMHDTTEYPTGLRLVLIMTSVLLAMFLMALDRLIVSTAIPAITDEFNSAGDIGWYGTAYMLTSCSFQLVFGKIYSFANIKTTYIAAILLFEIGSAVCGAAPTSIAFIIGRAIAGLGAGGIGSGTFAIIAHSLPLHKRPAFQGLFGAVFGISSVMGPLVGGAFTTDVTWRWCFFINLPIGLAALIVIVFLLDIPNTTTTSLTIAQKIRKVNPLGISALVPGVVSLCLALQWGGTVYAWNDGRVVATLTIGLALLVAFIAMQFWSGDEAILPPRIFSQRSIASAFWVSCCLGAHQLLLLYYLPIWFQAVQGTSAVESGIRLLPMMIPVVIASVVSGKLISSTGYYAPFMIAGVCLTAVGAGLITTFSIYTSAGMWIGYQVIYGFGFGLCGQTPNMAAQTVLSKKEVAIGASFMLFGQQLFGAIFTSVGQNVLNNQLAERLSAFTSFNPASIQSTGATEILSRIPAQFHTQALMAYNGSLRVCFQVALIMACLAILGCVTIEWLSVKQGKPSNTTDVEKAAGDRNESIGVSERASIQDIDTKEAEQEKKPTAGKDHDDSN